MEVEWYYTIKRNWNPLDFSDHPRYFELKRGDKTIARMLFKKKFTWMYNGDIEPDQGNVLNLPLE